VSAGEVVKGRREKSKLLQEIASKDAILVLLRLGHMFLSATSFVGLSMCSSLVAVGFSTSKQQFVRR
jgi:hypothetical protein